MWKKVVVTGAAGFIGGHLCRYLVESGVNEVIGIDSLRSGDWNRTPSEVHRIEKDISVIDQVEWENIFENTDVLFHLAAEKYNSSKSTPAKLLDINVVSTERLFRVASKMKVKRTVFTSSLYAYGHLGPSAMKEDSLAAPITLYGASKLMGEGILRSIDRDESMSWNVARLFFIYGPHQHAEGGYKSVILSNFERLIRGQQPVIFGDGNQSLDYVYIDDCIEALIELAKSVHDKQIVNVSSGNFVSVNQLTAKMTLCAESEIKPKFGKPDWTHETKRYGSNELMENKFGWRTRTSLEIGLKNIYLWQLKSTDDRN